MTHIRYAAAACQTDLTNPLDRASMRTNTDRMLAMIDAALGHKELALDEGRRAIALTPLEKDVNNGSLVLQYFAITAAWAGDKELALQQLETGLRAPVASVLLSYGALKLLPYWDPLRGDPRFEKIVASLAPKEPPK